MVHDTPKLFDSIVDLVTDSEEMRRLASPLSENDLWAQVSVRHFFNDSKFGEQVEVFNKGVKYKEPSIMCLLDEALGSSYLVGSSFEDVNRCLSKSGNRTFKLDSSSGKIIGVYNQVYQKVGEKYEVSIVETYRARSE